MDQLFFIGMTLAGFGWNDLLDLTDRDRLAFVERCVEHNDRQSREVDTLKRGVRGSNG